MKTKNILKIGVFSIVILSLLISPILKSNSPQVKAATPDAATAEFCKKYSTMNLPDYAKEQGISEVAAKAEYVERCCDPGYDWGADQQLINNRCDTLSGGVELAAEMSTTTTGTISESEAAKWCDAIYGDGWKGTPFISKNWWGYTFCVMQLSAIEGIGAAISGVTQSLIGYILWALNPVTYGGFVKNTAVQGVWSVLRNFMNLALVLILVFIAIATILGIKKYRWQETLWKLVIVALLINFSLIIPGIILDTSHFITYTFLNLAEGDDLNIADSMMKLLATEELARADKYNLAMIDDIKATYSSSTKETSVNASGWGLGIGKSLIVTTLLLLVGIFAIIALVAIFFTMIFRAFMIIALLCVAPIAFAAWILPNTAGLWKTWWNHFLKWCTFPITFALMLYIGIYIMTNIKIDTADLAKGNIKIGLIATVVQMILFSMFLVGGLIFSIQGGGTVSKIVMQQASKAGAAVRGFAAKTTAGVVKESPTYKKAGQALTHIPLLKGVGQEMMLAGEKGKMARVKGHEKNFENVGLSTLKQLEEAPLPSPLERQAYEQRIALTSKLAEMGQLGNNSIQFIKQNINDGRFDAKAITEALPHYFNIGEDKQLAETGDKISDKVKALSRIKPDKLRDKTQTSDFVKNIMRDKKAIAAKEGKTETEQNTIEQEAFEETIQEIAKKLSPAQLAGFWQGISPKDMVEGEWGGPEGKLAQAIKKDEQAKKKFYEEAIPTSQILRAASGIISKEPEKSGKQNEGPKETPPYPGWVKKGGIWTSPEE